LNDEKASSPGEWEMAGKLSAAAAVEREEKTHNAGYGCK
jgi:hypothetical protein